MLPGRPVMRSEHIVGAVLSLALSACLGPLPGTEASAASETAADPETVETPPGGPSRVYFFDGFFVHLEVPALNRALEGIQRHLDEHHPGATLARWHQSLWRSVCDEVSALPETERPAHLVLIGHSFGVGAAMDTARCLGDRPIDLVVSIDSVTRIQTPDQDVVPDNVLVSPNFFQEQGILRGSQNNHRADGTYGGITNTLVQVPPSLSPHYGIVNELVESGTLPARLDEAL